ncbi:MAG: GNAT family protein [Candidatus Hydrogenedentes bacterium]|nr:GNAT family protein [Candidatus Hydrogenedentota bacterium]
MELRLRRPERSDLDIIVDWMGDAEFRHFLFGDTGPRPQHMGQQVLGVMSSALAIPMASAGNLLLEDDAAGTIGIVMLQDVSWRNRSCFLALYLAAEHRNGETIARATDTVFTYCFEELNLHRAAMRVEAGQTEYAQACTQAGAVREFVMPGHAQRDGKPVDVHGYGVLRAEFDARRNVAAGA